MERITHNVKEVVFEDGSQLETIGAVSFYYFLYTTEIELPETVTEIGREAFAGCTALRGLYLPLGTESIGPGAFAGCISMESVYIPATVTEVASGAFDDCVSLLYLFYEGDFEDWNAVYPDFINPFTTAICIDGSYYHGTGR